MVRARRFAYLDAVRVRSSTFSNSLVAPQNRTTRPDPSKVQASNQLQALSRVPAVLSASTQHGEETRHVVLVVLTRSNKEDRTVRKHCTEI